jgi:peptidoglycan-N-acetylglucosamine deacetylase
MRFLSIIFILICEFSTAQQIAITFDDAPMGDGPLFTGAERTTKILTALQKNHVKQAAFFVITSQIDSPGLARLKKYSDAGHLLANHSHSHNWIRIMGTKNYIYDIRRSDSILSTTVPYKRWYRYPFLDEGRTLSSRDSIRSALASLKLFNAYVTIDNYDWYLNGALRQAVARNADIDYAGLKELYIDHIWKAIQFYDSIGRSVLNRSPKHVLLLHENDLSALFVGDLITFLRKKGWKIISPEDAYSDPIASEIPDVLFNGQGRVAAIAYSKGKKASELVQASEDEAYLDQLIAEKKIFVIK